MFESVEVSRNHIQSYMIYDTGFSLTYFMAWSNLIKTFTGPFLLNVMMVECGGLLVRRLEKKSCSTLLSIKFILLINVKC